MVYPLVPTWSFLVNKNFFFLANENNSAASALIWFLFCFQTFINFLLEQLEIIKTSE